MAQKYEYTALPNDDHIRLIKIEPADAFDDELVITLRDAAFDNNTTNKDTNPEYDALSYAWGDEKEPLPVRMGGSISETGVTYSFVTQNLEIALRYLRQTSTDRLWWIDALCINQSDDVEKSVQVRKMGNIYRRAYRVVAWLGAPTPLSSYGLKGLRQLGATFRFNFKSRTITYDPEVNQKATREEPKLFQLELRFTLCEAILDIIERPWLLRIWIRQEIYLADPALATVQCGTDTISWLEFRNALAGLSVQPLIILADRDEDNTIALPFRLMSRLEMVGSLILQDEHVQLHALRSMLAQSRCKDDRDRIYAVLDMLPPAHKDIGILPDYTKTVNQVFHDVAVRYIQHTQNAAILVQCHLRDGAQQHQPSWAPYWTYDEWQKPLQWNGGACSDISVPKHAPIILGDPNLGSNSILRMFGVPGPILEDLASPVFLRVGDSMTERVSKLRHALFPFSALTACRPNEHRDDRKIMEIYASVLFRGDFGEISCSQMGISNPAVFLQRLETCLSWQGSDQSLCRELGKPGLDLVRIAVDHLAGSRLALSRDKELLIVPESAMEGDQVCSLLGCDVPMLLRPSTSTISGEQGQYRVVGPCYSASMTWGDAFLGPLPAGIERIIDAEHLRDVWCDPCTGSIGSVIDPRLESILAIVPAGLADLYRLQTANGISSCLPVGIDDLQEHRRKVSASGGEIQCFDLI